MKTNNVFKTTSLDIGDSVTMTITDVKEGKYGAVYIGTIDGDSAEIRPSGNLKFLADDLAQGKKELGKAYTVTRIADKSIKGYSVTQFSVTEAASTATPTVNNTVADKLAAIRAKRAQSSNNG